MWPIPFLTRRLKVKERGKLEEASALEIARQICAAEGASGANSDYLLELAVALRELGLQDQHVFDIETHIVHILEQ